MTAHCTGREQTSTAQQITAAVLGLEQATTVTAVLTASLTAFQIIRELARGCEDRDPHLFAAFFSAAGAATEGREWIMRAVSSPPGSPAASIAVPPGTSAGEVADSLAILANALATRLAIAASTANAPGHDSACQNAAASARAVHDLLAGRGHEPGPR
jgi:hypothetical protein